MPRNTTGGGPNGRGAVAFVDVNVTAAVDAASARPTDDGAGAPDETVRVEACGAWPAAGTNAGTGDGATAFCAAASEASAFTAAPNWPFSASRSAAVSPPPRLLP